MTRLWALLPVFAGLAFLLPFCMGACAAAPAGPPQPDRGAEGLLVQLDSPAAGGKGMGREALLETPGPAASDLWRVGAALASAPLVLSDGSVALSSQEGTLDLLGPSGELRFSIALNGLPLGPMAADQRGWIYAATAQGVVVATRSDGARAWAFRAPRGIRGGVALTEGQGVAFRSGETAVQAINRSAVPALFLELPSKICAGPVAWGGAFAVGTVDGWLVRFHRGGNRKLMRLERPIDQLVPVGKDKIWLLAERDAILIDVAGNVVARHPGFSGLAALGSASGATTQQTEEDGTLRSVAWSGIDGRLKWLDEQGRPVTELPLSHRVRQRAGTNPRLGVTPDGIVVVAAETGWVQFISPRGILKSYRLRSAVRFDPVVDAPRKRVLLGVQAGWTQVVGFP